MDRFEVTVEFEGEAGLPITIGAYSITSNTESDRGPAGNEWAADVLLTGFLFYTTPESPVNIKYKVILESKNEFVLDGVFNEWDMNPATPVIETKGTLTFNIDLNGNITNLGETYEEVE